MKLRTSLKLLGAACVCLALHSGSAFAQQKEKVVLMLNWYVTGQHAPFFLGQTRGYFAQEGIDLEIQEGRGSGPTVQAVASRNVTFGYADVPTMIKIAAKGAPVRTVGVALQKSPISVMGLAEKKVNKPEDIKGKIVAMTPGDSPSQAWPMFLKKTGLKEGDFKTVSGDAKTKVNAVISGQADLLLGYSTDQNNEIEQVTKKPVKVILFADFDVNSVSSGIVVHRDTIKDNPDLVKRFMRASTKAFEESQKNPQAAVDATMQLNPKLNRDSVLNGLNSSIALFHTPETAKDRPFRVSPISMTQTMDMLVQFGGLEKSAGNASTYYTNEFLP